MPLLESDGAAGTENVDVPVAAEFGTVSVLVPCAAVADVEEEVVVMTEAVVVEVMLVPVPLLDCDETLSVVLVPDFFVSVVEEVTDPEWVDEVCLEVEEVVSVSLE